MINITLYRKYRPKKFSEIVGQEHITKTIQNELIRNQISHAYIFSGPRGVGKTTMARLLAKSLNCLNLKDGEPCNKCENCKAISESRFLDLIEIDAASHTSVDDVREIIERVRLAPTTGEYKVYIVDETHMLSKSAFNALLKTLEEPPRHAVFILATTEIFKVPETIISRCERFDFQKLNAVQIKKRLKTLIKKERLQIEDGAISLIARAARGALRDAESLLAQIISFGSKKIKEEEVKTFLGITDKKAINDFISALIKKDSKKAISLVNELSASGYDLEEFLKELIEHLREILLVKIDEGLMQFSESILSNDDKEILNIQKEGFSLDSLLKTIKLFIIAENEIKGAFYPELPLEIAIIELCGDSRHSEERSDEESHRQKNKENKNNYRSSDPERSRGGVENPKDQAKTKNNKKDEGKSKITESGHGEKTFLKIKENWNKVIYRIRDKNASLAAFLRAAKPVSLEDRKLLVFVPYGFYKERILATQNRHLIEDTISNITGDKILVDAKSEAEFIRFGLNLPEDESSFAKAPVSASTSAKATEDKEEKKMEQEKMVSEAITILGGELVD